MSQIRDVLDILIYDFGNCFEFRNSDFGFNSKITVSITQYRALGYFAALQQHYRGGNK